MAGATRCQPPRPMSPPPPTAKPALTPATSSAEAITAIRALIRRGEYLTAYDAAEEAAAHEFQPPLNPVTRAEIGDLRVLALAHSGSARRAMVEANGLQAALPVETLPP